MPMPMPNAAPVEAAVVEDIKSLFKYTTEEQRNECRIDTTKVIVKASPLGGDGAFARVPIKKGELVEYGIARRVDLDGHKNPFVFTWSDDRTVWATTSGCAMFYNTHPTTPNTEMIRFFGEDRFEIFALKDIEAGEELLHTYRSLKWRQIFVESLPQN